MQIEVPSEYPYPTMFLLSHRVDSFGNPEQVGTIVIKGTFQGMNGPIAVEKDQQIPIFTTDIPFLVPNGDFEAEGVAPWTVTGGTVEQVVIPEKGENNKWAKLTSNGGANSLIQTITFNEPLAKAPNQNFVLSFAAWAENSSKEEPVTIDGYLRAVDSDARICQFSAQLTDQIQYVSTNPEQWPDTELGTTMELFLSGSGVTNHPVYFDQVQVYEEQALLRYEHDLVPFKPVADVIILGAAKPPDELGTNPTGIWYVVVETSSGQRFEKKFDASQIKRFPTKTVFGWASRGEGERLVQAGQDLDEFDPAEAVLPNGFDNRFFNGYERTLSGDIPLPYLLDNIQLTIRSERRTADPPQPQSFRVRLPARRPKTILTLLNEGAQEETQAVPLALDTVIVEPELDRYLVVWRGIWQWDDANQDRYLKLSIQGGA